jgi:hypothetical protein
VARPKGLDWMPLDIAAFYDSERVARLSPAAEALYIRLLCRCFAHGSLPSTSDFVKPMFPKFADGWDALWEEVRPLFDEVDGRLVNERATAEREHSLKVLNARREAGKAGGRPSKTVREANAFHLKSKAEPQPNQCEPQDRTGQDRDRTERDPSVSQISAHPRGACETPLEVEALPDDGSDSMPAAPKPRKPRANGGNAMTRHWDAEWERLRPDHGPFPWTNGHAAALARCSKFPGSSPEEVCRRITRLLASQDKFHLRSATPQMLQSVWANLPADAVRPLSQMEMILQQPIPDYPPSPTR